MEKKRIKVNNLYKKFDLDFKRNEGFLYKIISFIKKEKVKKEIEVIKSVSFETYSGENVGIIGRNGSGKSTLLRLIAGIYQPDSGSIETIGKVVYLNGLGQGLKDRLTMRENIFLIGSIMGLSQKNIKRKFNEIVEFSGLKDFLDMKVSQFSSGMVIRLTFSITIFCIEHNSPDVILLDEVFGSGGDIEFQNKATNKMEELINGGATVIIVSHSMDIIKKYCSRVLYLEHGEILNSGPVEKIIKEYEDSF